jgi:probable HAF family extracellular repeat protein
MPLRHPRVLVGAVVLVALAGRASATNPFEELGFLTSDGRGPCIPHAVSADGSTIVGMSNSETGFQAFRWTGAGGMVGLGAFDNPGGLQSSQAMAVSADGSVIVGASSLPRSLNEDGSPFRWTAQTGLVFLGSLGGTDGGVAFGVSADGSVVVGYGSDSNFNLEAFRWAQATGPVALGDVPGGPVNSQAHGVSADGTFVVGYGSHSFVFDTGFHWQSGTGLVGYAGGFKALGVSADGSAAVGTAGGRAAIVTSGGTTMIPHIGPATSTDTAYAASADGSVVVGIMSLNQGQEDLGHAFIWDAVNGTRLFELLLPTLGVDLTGWELNAATGISADGRVICGYGMNPHGEQAGWAVHLPGGCGSADFNCDGDVGTDADIEAFFACLGGNCPLAPCQSNADFNADGDVGTDADIEAFFRVLGGGAC